MTKIDHVSVFPLLLKHHPQQRRPGAQHELVGADLLSMDVELDVLAGLVLKQPPEELGVGLPPLGDGGQHLVIQKQLPDGVRQGSVDTSLPVKGAGVTNCSIDKEVFNQLQVPTEAGVVEGGGVPLVAEVQVQLLVLHQVSDIISYYYFTYTFTKNIFLSVTKSIKVALTLLVLGLHDDSFETDLGHPWLYIKYYLVSLNILNDKTTGLLQISYILFSLTLVCFLRSYYDQLRSVILLYHWWKFFELCHNWWIGLTVFSSEMTAAKIVLQQKFKTNDNCQAQVLDRVIVLVYHLALHCSHGLI